MENDWTFRLRKKAKILCALLKVFFLSEIGYSFWEKEESSVWVKGVKCVWMSMCEGPLEEMWITGYMFITFHRGGIRRWTCFCLCVHAGLPS